MDATAKAQERVRKGPCSVFFAYNTADRQDVEMLAEALKGRAGVLPSMVDNESLFESDLWQTNIREALEHVQAAAVFFGPSGATDWRDEELEVLQDACASKHLPLIPVLLPGARAIPPRLRSAAGQADEVRFPQLDEEAALSAFVQRLCRQKPR
jgi:hypothetical protein